MTLQDSAAHIPAQARVCIAGGGPAGMMLGYLLARAGIDVLVLEKHRDFLRDFRGDTVHPSTLQVIKELGLLEDFLAEPHDKVRTVSATIGGETLVVGDFSHLKTGCPFIVLMPQWNFLNFLVGKARRYPSFHLAMEAGVDGLLGEGDRVVGVRVATPGGPREVRCDLVVGADGRNSLVRQRAGLEVEDLGAPIDVLWLRLSRRSDDPSDPVGSAQRGRIFIMIPRSGYWQCGFVIPKSGFETVRAAGVEAFQRSLADLAPFLGERVHEITSWDQVSLLTVRVDRLRRWYRPGLLCIGDAAHAMSPIGGVGINLAIQDAVAAANILALPLRKASTPEVALLRRIQNRRVWPTRVTQMVQVLIQDRVLSRVFQSTGPVRLPWPLRLSKAVPALRRLPGYAVGVGVRPEHVHTPELGAAPPQAPERPPFQPPAGMVPQTPHPSP